MKLDESINKYNARNDTKLSRLDLGKKVFPGYSDPTIHSTMSRWANGIYKPMPEIPHLITIADELGVTVDYLIGRTKKLNTN